MTGFSHIQILKARAVYHANVLNYQNTIMRLLHLLEIRARQLPPDKHHVTGLGRRWQHGVSTP